MTTTVVMFAKSPVPGEVKTRLAATVGARRAATLHRAFLADLAATIASLDVRPVLSWAGDVDHAGFDPHREAGFEFVEQPAGNLGARLDAVVRELARDSEHVLVIGSDSPTLQPDHFHDALRRLRAGADVVVGPSFDGGYYLIGVSAKWYLDLAPPDERHPLFDQISWSTTDVLGQTLRRCREISALCDLTAFWYDVDTIEDLELLRTHLLDYLLNNRQKLTQTAAILKQMSEEGTLPQPGEGRFGDESEEE